MQFDAPFMEDEAPLLLKEMPIIESIKLVCLCRLCAISRSISGL